MARRKSVSRVDGIRAFNTELASVSKTAAQPTLNFVYSLLVDWSHFATLALLILLFDTALTLSVIALRPYTEIDWRAYMQEVEGWAVRRESPTDYSTLRGDTGPLVYPAGFMWAFRGLRALASLRVSEDSALDSCARVEAASSSLVGLPPAPCGGLDVRAAQWAFALIYIASQAFVLDIYHLARPGPPWMCILLAFSIRLHSIYVLRLFNDCVAMLFAHAALSMIARRRFLIGGLLFSLSVSIKMNSLLALPALGLVLLRNVGVFRTAGILSACVLLQAVLAFPFLATHPASYLSKAFEFSRVFSFQWTVNWKFISEETFVSRNFALALLGMHLIALLYFAHRVWLARDGGLLAVIYKICLLEFESIRRGGVLSFVRGDAGGAYRDSPSFIVEVIWSCVFVGVAFARTLHFQFYAWYFHSLPFLLWRGTFVPAIPLMFATLLSSGLSKLARIQSLQTAREVLETALRVIILFSVEYAFTAVDRSLGPDGKPRGEPLPGSSVVLQAAHVLILVGLASRKIGRAHV